MPGRAWHFLARRRRIFFLISEIPVYTPNEGVWDWFVVGKAGLQLLQVHCKTKTGDPPGVGAVQWAVQPLLWLLAKTHQP